MSRKDDLRSRPSVNIDGDAGSELVWCWAMEITWRATAAIRRRRQHLVDKPSQMLWTSLLPVVIELDDVAVADALLFVGVNEAEDQAGHGRDVELDEGPSIMKLKNVLLSAGAPRTLEDVIQLAWKAVNLCY
ncbi:hypothetical protein EDB19DRAFT_1827295 [Suillus lakei]|nr:hypothetical protein EDB19DRAFT_1827295 [Suillus lakei]